MKILISIGKITLKNETVGSGNRIFKLWSSLHADALAIGEIKVAWLATYCTDMKKIKLKIIF